MKLLGIFVAAILHLGWAAPAWAQLGPAAPIERSEAAIATDRAAAKVAALEAAHARAEAQKQALQKSYQAQLASIDALKRQRPSWRRDGQIRDQLAASLTTARRLSAVDDRLRSLEKRLARARAAFLPIASRELASRKLSATRRALVSQLHGAAARALRPRAEKIVLPDTHIDPLADPEELEYQAALILEAERELRREARKLAQRAQRFQHMAALTKTQRRASELEALDDRGPRRRTARVGSGNGTRTGDGLSGGGEPAQDDGSPTPPGEDPDVPPDDFDPEPVFDPVIVLADVVDTGTLDALRAAVRSSNPAVKARAARRAHAAVERRIEKLAKRRRQILNRARNISQ